jgi:hypothetical protein
MKPLGGLGNRIWGPATSKPQFQTALRRFQKQLDLSSAATSSSRDSSSTLTEPATTVPSQKLTPASPQPSSMSSQPHHQRRHTESTTSSQSYVDPEPKQQLPLPIYPTIRQQSAVPGEYQSIDSPVGSPPTDRHRSESSRQSRMDPQLQQLREEMRQMIQESLQAFQNQNQPAPQQNQRGGE